MMMGTADGLGILIPKLSNHAAVIVAETEAGAGGSPMARVPQWSEKETRDFIAVRGNLERDFRVSKRNKALWEAVAASMKERGYRRSPEQCKCKWKNLVNRYKGKETSDPENGKQCPFFDELHTIFTERAMNMQQLLESETGSPDPFTKKLKRSNRDKVSYESSDSNEDDGEESDAKVHEQKKSKLASRSIQELLRDYFQKQQRFEVQWRDLIERRAQEQRICQDEWRKSMVKLERERLMLEQSWQEREEQRRFREESRAVKRDALLMTILTKLGHEDL